MRSLKLQPGTIDVWEVDARDDAWDRWRGALDPWEKWRAAELRRPDAYERFVRTRAALRRVLASYTEQDPAALHFGYGRHGKPELLDQSVCFNVAHCGPRALIAVSHATIGIDMEHAAPESATFRVLEAVILHPRERIGLASLSPGERLQTFYRTWVRKESYVKLLGVGLLKHLSEFQVVQAPSGDAGTIDDPAEQGSGVKRLLDIDPGESYVASLCTPLPSARVVLRAAYPDLWPAALAGVMAAGRGAVAEAYAGVQPGA